MLALGIPKEIKSLEKRVGLTPEGVGHLCSQGIRVYVQTGAGSGSGYSDQEYEVSGARIASDAAQLFAQADLIQKVKEPLPPEYPLLRKNQILFCFLHLASPDQAALVDALTESGVTALGYETVQVEGRVPVLAPMSEIAGALASAYAAYFLDAGFLKSERQPFPADLTSHLEAVARFYPQPPKNLRMSKVVIFGGGSAGQKAAEFALAMDGDVALVEKNQDRVRSLRNQWQAQFPNLRILGLDEDWMSDAEKADVLIGCVHVPGQRAAQVLSADQLRSFSRTTPKIIMDVAIDQGGNFPGSKATRYTDPVYRDGYGNIRFGVTNVPSLCGRGASAAITRSTLAYTAAMAADFHGAVKKFPELNAAINVQGGRIVHPAVLREHARS